MNSVARNVIYKLFIKLNNKRTKKLKLHFFDYLDTVFYVLKNGVAWNAICDKRVHYTTFFKFYKNLVKLDIFNIAYKILGAYYCKQNINNFKNIFIDATMIKNINGHDNLGPNHYDRCRKGNKITVLVDNTGIPISIHITKSNIHELKAVDSIINGSVIKLVKCRIIADKGYNDSKTKLKLRRKHNISLIYPYKKNQKDADRQRKLNTTFERNLLKKRYIVEHFFSWLKKYKRIRQRYDKQCVNYLNFVYFGVINMIANRLYPHAKGK